MSVDLEQRFTHAWLGEPDHRPVRDRVSAGRRAVRRRRSAGGVGAVAVLAVVGGAAVAGLGGAAPGSDPDRGADPLGGSSIDPAPLPVRPWPFAGQVAGSAPPVWQDDDGRIYRSAAGVQVVEQAVAAPIVDLDGRRVGQIDALWTRWRGSDEVNSFGAVDGRAAGSTAIASRPRSEESWEQTLRLLRTVPHVVVGTAASGQEIASHPVGITADGSIELRFAGAGISQQGPASAWSERRFDAAPPEAGVVTWLDYRFFALVGYRSDGHDVIVVEPAGQQGLDAWLRDVERRMEAGEELG